MNKIQSKGRRLVLLFAVACVSACGIVFAWVNVNLVAEDDVPLIVQYLEGLQPTQEQSPFQIEEFSRSWDREYLTDDVLRGFESSWIADREPKGFDAVINVYVCERGRVYTKQTSQVWMAIVEKGEGNESLLDVLNGVIDFSPAPDIDDIRLKEMLCQHVPKVVRASGYKDTFAFDYPKMEGRGWRDVARFRSEKGRVVFWTLKFTDMRRPFFPEYTPDMNRRLFGEIPEMPRNFQPDIP